MTIRDIDRIGAGLQGADLTGRIIELLGENPLFRKIAREELALLNRRDEEDAYKLDQGIEYALARGILTPRSGDAPSWMSLAVDGKTPREIFGELQLMLKGEAGGSVIALCGDSGVGKGTLVQLMLDEIGGTVTWSNGDMFRLLCLLTLREEPEIESRKERLEGIDYSALAGSVEITGEGVFLRDSGGLVPLEDLKNGVLKQTAINRLLPHMARFTQGQVINLTNRYLELNRKSTVLIEGRKQTLNFLKADRRFELIMVNREILGARRAAQKIAARLKEEKYADWEADRFLSEAYN